MAVSRLILVRFWKFKIWHTLQSEADLANIEIRGTREIVTRARDVIDPDLYMYWICPFTRRHLYHGNQRHGMPSTVRENLILAERHFLLVKRSCKGCNIYFCEKKSYRKILLALFIMCTIAFTFLRLVISVLLLLWKPLYLSWIWLVQRNCGSISFRYIEGLTAKSRPFRPQLRLKVRNFRFPWQPFWILKFWQREVALWPRKIVRAQFCQDRSRNREVDSELKKRPRLPACVFSQIIIRL